MNSARFCPIIGEKEFLTVSNNRCHPSKLLPSDWPMFTMSLPRQLSQVLVKPCMRLSNDVKPSMLARDHKSISLLLLLSVLFRPFWWRLSLSVRDVSKLLTYHLLFLFDGISISSSLHVCSLCMCLCGMCMLVCVQVLGVCVWRPKVKVWCLPPLLFTSFLKTGSLSLAEEL